jgi:hypothetical protein
MELVERALLARLYGIRQSVATIRAALVAAIEHHGGDVEHEPDPGRSDFVASLEDPARAALALLPA